MVVYGVVDFPGCSDGEEYTCNAGDRVRSLAGWGVGGRSPGEGNGYPLQYSCLGNPIDREAWLAIVYGVAKNRTWLND